MLIDLVGVMTVKLTLVLEDFSVCCLIDVTEISLSVLMLAVLLLVNLASVMEMTGFAVRVGV